LGVTPYSTQVEYRCTTSRDGYGVGDIVVIHSGERYSTWQHVIGQVTSNSARVMINNAGPIFRGPSTTSNNAQWNYFTQIRFTCIA
jgi:hypothetical protein